MKDPRYEILICEDCKEEFVFTAEAKLYFYKKGLKEDPKRCKHCYGIYKGARRPGQGDKPVEPRS